MVQVKLILTSSCQFVFCLCQYTMWHNTCVCFTQLHEQVHETKTPDYSLLRFSSTIKNISCQHLVPVFWGSIVTPNNDDSLECAAKCIFSWSEIPQKRPLDNSEIIQLSTGKTQTQMQKTFQCSRVSRLHVAVVKKERPPYQSDLQHLIKGQFQSDASVVFQEARTATSWMDGDDAHGTKNKRLSWKTEGVAQKLELKLALKWKLI